MKSQMKARFRNVAAKGLGLLAARNRKRLSQPQGGNPFLTGLHEPMRKEVTLTGLPVTGTIPPGLDGRYLRMGPNPAAAYPPSYHWFTGDGMVHGVAIAEGKAPWYRNRWIRSNRIARILGVPPAPGPHRDFDTVNTNVVAIGGRTFALVEAGSWPVKLGETLDEQTYDPFGGSLKGSFSAHPHRDPKTGQFHAICYEGHDSETIRHVVIDARGTVIREEPISVRHGPMIHDCAITDRFVILLDLPVTFSIKAMVAGYSLPYRENPAHEARVGLLPHEGRQEDVIWCPVRPGYAFHVANAYDAEDGTVVLDLCVYETMFGNGASRAAVYGPDARSRGLERWTIDPKTRTVAIRTLDPVPQEFPRPDERFFGNRNRYVWSVALPPEPSPAFLGATKLYAHDLETGERQVHDFGPNRYPGEFVFVPETQDAPEGHGWLMGLVIDMETETTDLAILDARRFAEPPVARVHLPHRVPAGFHGNWIEGSAAMPRHG